MLFDIDYYFGYIKNNLYITINIFILIREVNVIY